MNYNKLEKRMYHVKVLHPPIECIVPEELQAIGVRPCEYYTLRLIEEKKPWNRIKIRVFESTDSILFEALSEILAEEKHSKSPCKVKDKLPGRILNKKYNVFLFASECNPESAHWKLHIAKERYKRKHHQIS